MATKGVDKYVIINYRNKQDTEIKNEWEIDKVRSPGKISLKI